MGIGFWELLLIAVVIAVLFNQKRLRRLGRALRGSKAAYKRGLEEPVVGAPQLPEPAEHPGPKR